jgi:tRNA(fMet)-specific endonuclease VapC
LGLIVDTNALSAIADGDSEIEEFIERASLVAIPVIVLGEYRFGIMQSKRRTQHERWLRESLPSYRILDLTEETSQHYAALRVELKRTGKPIPSNDLWIAALCRQHDLSILSRDRHFDLVPGIERIDW